MTDQTEQTDDLATRQFTPIGGDAAAPGAPQPEQAQEPQRLTNAQIVAGALAAGRDVFCIVTKLESPRQHLDAAAVQQLGQLWGPVLDKHGIDLAAYLGDYALEIAAALGTVTIAAKLRAAVIDEMIAKRPTANSAPANNGDTVNA
jgi:hypothetical protein